MEEFQDSKQRWDVDEFISVTCPCLLSGPTHTVVVLGYDEAVSLLANSRCKRRTGGEEEEEKHKSKVSIASSQCSNAQPSSLYATGYPLPPHGFLE
jgi:hypothetical protein